MVLAAGVTYCSILYQSDPSINSFTTLLITPAFAGRTNVLILLAFLAAAISDCCYFTMDTFNKLIYRDDIMEIFNCLYRERENLRKLGLKLRHNLLKNCCFIYLIMHTTTVLWDLAACWVYMLKLDRAVDVIFGVSLSYMNLAQAISVSVYITMILTTQNMFHLYVILWGFLAVVCKDGLKLSVLLIVTDKCQKEEIHLKTILYKITNNISGVQATSKLNGFSLQLLHDKIEFIK
ncbi:7tm Chemosensory receptor [Popillia japonica]|uniref:7tm Chemosensory receptor n=1 Tax=Popillia japonica TaxID=7064 RepID=A0AAW1NLT5_POPJA